MKIRSWAIGLPALTPVKVVPVVAYPSKKILFLGVIVSGLNTFPTRRSTDISLSQFSTGVGDHPGKTWCSLRFLRTRVVWSATEPPWNLNLPSLKALGL